jgi:hypothetical protein
VGVKKMMLPSFVGVGYMVVVVMNESESFQNDTLLIEIVNTPCIFSVWFVNFTF